MGFADRHYQRVDQGGSRFGGGGYGGRGLGGGGALNWRLWSVTTWLIAICAGIFVVDAFLPRATIVMSTQVETVYIEAGVDLRNLERGEERVDFGQLVRPLYAMVQGERTAVGLERLRRMPPLEAAMHYSTSRMLQIEFWRLIGFQFLHSHDTLFHIAMNCMGLFFFGPLVERELGARRFLAFYLLCGIAGALLYTLLNLGGIVMQMIGGPELGFLLFYDMSTPLVGASAGVFGVLIAGARIAPGMTVQLFFVLPIKFAVLAWVIVGLEMFFLLTGSSNQGGHAAHLGGAIAGWYLMRNPQHLRDFFDIFGRMSPGRGGGSGGRGWSRGEGRRSSGITKLGFGRRGPRGAPDPAEVDRILEKVFEKGLAGLTSKERKILEADSKAKEAAERRAS